MRVLNPCLLHLLFTFFVLIEARAFTDNQPGAGRKTEEILCRPKSLLKDYPASRMIPMNCTPGNCNSEHQYLFAIVPPFHGSTALVHLLGTSPTTSTMCDSKIGGQHCEGSWQLTKMGLIEGKATRWNEDQPKDWIKALNVLKPMWRQNRCLLVDKSPPNVAKVHQIARTLRAGGIEPAFLFMTRSSCTMSEKTHQHMKNDHMSDLEYMRTQMEAYKEVLQAGFPALHIRYEDFFPSTTSSSSSSLHPVDVVCSRILQFAPCLESLDPRAQFSAKTNDRNYETTFQRPHQRATNLVGVDRGRKLSIYEYVEQHRSLHVYHPTLPSSYKDVLDFFGYQYTTVTH